MRKPLLALSLLAAGAFFACAPTKPLATVPQVDLGRFMGDWYVQGHIPVGSEADAYNGVESYALGEDGRILTSYVFRDGSFDGDLETLEPVGFVKNRETNAEWGMRIIWPFKAQYLITHLDEEYTETIIARARRDYAWIMTRDQVISEERFERLVQRLGEMGYDLTEVRRVPQRWPDSEHPVTEAGGDLARFTRAK
ncbi:MAG: lipocalin family protein [Planctomycetota bacterium]|nr:lipocalin family protein [Planctomycetota bacterium]MDG1986008.1 lipocalin family protein [Planctomycetota bacterium]